MLEICTILVSYQQKNSRGWEFLHFETFTVLARCWANHVDNETNCVRRKKGYKLHNHIFMISNGILPFYLLLMVFVRKAARKKLKLPRYGWEKNIKNIVFFLPYQHPTLSSSRVVLWACMRVAALFVCGACMISDWIATRNIESYFYFLRGEMIELCDKYACVYSTREWKDSESSSSSRANEKKEKKHWCYQDICSIMIAWVFVTTYSTYTTYSKTRSPFFISLATRWCIVDSLT